MMKKPEKIPEKNPFRVPEGYFEEVNKKIISATIEKSHGVRRSVIPVQTQALPSGSCFIAGFIITQLYGNQAICTSQDLSLHQSEVIPEEYFSPYMNDLDIYSP